MDETFEEMLRRLQEQMHQNYNYQSFHDRYYGNSWYDDYKSEPDYPQKVEDAKELLEECVENNDGILYEAFQEAKTQAIIKFGFSNLATKTDREKLPEEKRIEIFEFMVDFYIKVQDRINKECKVKPVRCKKCGKFN